MAEQPFLGRGAAEIAADRAVASQHPVARNDDRHGVVRAGRADGAHGARIVEGTGHLAVGAGFAQRDALQVAQHRAAKWWHAGQRHGERELPARAGEVLRELCHRRIEPLRRLDDATATPVSRLGDEGGGVLVGETDPHETMPGGDEQQRSQRGIDAAMNELLGSHVSPFALIRECRRSTCGQTQLPSHMYPDHCSYGMVWPLHTGQKYSAATAASAHTVAMAPHATRVRPRPSVTAPSDVRAADGMSPPSQARATTIARAT